MRRPRTLAAFFRRLAAAGTAALVLALAVFAASPQLHDWLHVDDGHAGGDEGCAVTLFAGGVSLPLDPVAVSAPRAAWRVAPPAAIEQVFVATPRYLRQPERGPPVV